MDAHKQETYVDFFKIKNYIFVKKEKLFELIWVQDDEISKINICDESNTIIEIFRYYPHP